MSPLSPNFIDPSFDVPDSIEIPEEPEPSTIISSAAEFTLAPLSAVLMCNPTPRSPAEGVP